MKGAILIISGPSGAGKSSLIKKVVELVPDSCFSISTTTRKMRNGEKDGVNYFFTTKDSFEQDIENGFFLEWAKVHENYYGTSLKQIVQCLRDGKLIILDIDVQGHKIAREKFGNFITSIFVTTSSQDVLKDRLTSRNTDTSSEIDKRLNNAISEMTHLNKYDYIVINESFDNALNQVVSIAKNTRNKTSNINLEEFVSSWIGFRK